jgi:hypothetical protein
VEAHTQHASLYIGYDPFSGTKNNGTYNLSAGKLQADSLVYVAGRLNYSGGEMVLGDWADDQSAWVVGALTNDGTTNLSKSGVRTLDGNVINNGTFETVNTNGYFPETFTNNAAFISDSSVNRFTDLIIGVDGSMQGGGEDLWYVGGRLLGVNIAHNTVTNIAGAKGMYVYYVPSVPENAYLKGKTYNLTGGGKLTPKSTVPTLVGIDIRPGIYPNDVDLKSKDEVPVAILTTADFDANSVDIVTVALAGAKRARCAWEDVNNDGRVDLLCHFKTKNLNLDKESTVAILTGKTLDGTNILGMDTVNIVPKTKK